MDSQMLKIGPRTVVGAAAAATARLVVESENNSVEITR